jgi:hypothetical protein
MERWFKDFIHNCLVHPLMPFLSTKAGNALHDCNATWAFGLHRYDELNLEKQNEIFSKIHGKKL